MDGRNSQKEDRSCIERYFGYKQSSTKDLCPLWRLWRAEKSHSFQFVQSLCYFGLCCRNMPHVAAEVDVRWAGWWSKRKLRCPCFIDKRQKNIQSPD